jgi:hypothetical protein
VAAIVAGACACAGADDDETAPPVADDPLTSAVRVEAFGCRSVAVVGGGSFVGAERILTVAHVVAGADRVEVLLADGTRVDADVVAIDSERDLAILHAEVEVPPLALGSANRGDPGEFVTFRDGSPAEMELRVQRVLELHDGEGIYEARQGYELAAEVLEGDSGTAMVVRGRIAGVIFARSTGHSHRAFAIDITEAATLLAVDDDERADTGVCTPAR